MIVLAGGISVPWPWGLGDWLRRKSGRRTGSSSGEGAAGEGSAGEAEEAAAGAEAGDIARFGGDDRESPYVTVYVASTLADAQIVKGRLESEGIPALLRYDALYQIVVPVPVGPGVKVQVPRALADRACLLLGSDES